METGKPRGRARRESALAPVASHCRANVIPVGPWTPMVVLFGACTFLSLDAPGDAIEDPSGTDPPDLPLDTPCRTIEVNLRQAVGGPSVGRR
jgi:predicted membrane chloride channel (bestrophin family)